MYKTTFTRQDILRAQSLPPGASQGPVLLKIGLPSECTRYEQLGPAELTFYLSVTLNVVVSPEILKLCESLSHENIIAKMRQHSYL